MFTLYSMQRSGNSYKARLALAQLRVPYRLIEVDILKGDSHTPEFLAKNPNGQVPLLEVAPGRYLAESNAILWYIAGGTPLAPEDRIGRAEALQWMFFEQHSLEPNLGAAYFWLTLVKGGRELQQHALEDWWCTTSLSPAITRSPTSRFTPMPISPRNAITTWGRFRRSAPGSIASPSSPATCRWSFGLRRRCRWSDPEFSPPETYSALMPAALMIGHHLSISAL
jgi:glutathione S-transferase